MVDYDLGKVVGDKGDTGNGISSIELISTSGKVKTYRITFTDGDHFDYQVSDGADGSSGIADIVTTWSATLSDTKVPSEKLAKNSLDAKLDNTISSTAVTIASNDNILITDYSDSNKVKRVSSILASQMKDSTAHSNIGSSANASQSTINTNIDTALSGKANSSSLSTVATSGSYNDLTNKPSYTATITSSTTGAYEIGKINVSGSSQTIYGKDTGGTSVDIVTQWESTPSDSKVASEKLTKDSLDDKVSKSSTSGLLKNDGSVDTTSYSTFDGNYNNLTNKPTIPSASSTTPSADTTSGSYGSGTSYARSNHSHPKSSLYAESTHTHTKSQITDFPSLSTVATSGSYSDLSNKPSIPSSSSDLSDGSDLVKKSSTTGLLKSDGSVDTNAYITSSALPTIQTSWGSTTSDSKVASEKLIKDSLDVKLDNTIGSSAVTIASDDNILITDTSDNSKVKKVANILASQVKDGSAHSNIGSSANATQSSINSSIDTALGGKQPTLISGTNIKTINSQSLLGSGNLTIQTLDDTKLFKYYYAPNDFITPNKWYADYDHGYPTFENGNLIFTTDYEYRFVFNEYPQKVRENFSITFRYKASASNQYNILRINGTTIVQNTTTENDVEITTTDGNAIVTNHTTNQTWDLQGNLEYIDLLVRSETASIYGYTYSANDSFEKQVPTEKVIQETALSIGTSKGATQSEINSAIASAIANMLTTSDVVDNLTSTSTTAPLSAKQGKVLNDLIGSAITYIIGSGS